MNARRRGSPGRRRRPARDLPGGGRAGAATSVRRGRSGPGRRDGRRPRAPRRSRSRTRPTRRAPRDGPPSRTTIGAPLAHASAPQSPRNTISGTSSIPVRRATSSRARSSTARTSAAVPFASLTMKLACFSEIDAPPIAEALQPGLVDQAAGRVAGRVAERAARRRDAERLVLAPPPPDLVEPPGDRRRIGRLETERCREDDVAGLLLEPAVAIA